MVVIEGVEFLNIWDFLLVPAYLILIYVVAYRIKARYIVKYSEYRYLIPGLSAKIFGVWCFIAIFIFYYKGGDTLWYFQGSRAIANLLIQDFEMGWRILCNDLSLETWTAFTIDTGYPPQYLWKDSNTMAVCRISSLLVLLGCKSYLVASTLLASFSYIGLWKLYRLFNTIYGGIQKPLAYCILFMPSLIFWGSGIMKDTYVLAATCWVTHNFYQLLIARRKIIINSFLIIMNIVIIINMKSYVLLSLLPGMFLWLNSAYLKKIANPIMKMLAFPFIISIISVIGFFVFSSLSSEMGAFGNVDTALKQAQIIQEDLSRSEQYGANNYYIGVIDGTPEGMVKLAPMAIFTSIYRPMFWEIGSPTMILSALENIVILLFTLYILVKVRPIRLIRLVSSQPILLYAFTFSILFAFGVGIAATNFGALVRYKIPMVPFYFAMLVVVFKLTRSNN